MVAPIVIIAWPIIHALDSEDAQAVHYAYNS